MTTPRLLMPQIAENQASKYITHNEALRVIDALTEPTAQAVLSTPPGSPAEGQCWIVGASPTGAWVGKTNQIAQWYNSAWYFYVASNGWEIFNIATNRRLIFNGTAWIDNIQRLNPQSIQSANYTLVLNDAGTDILHPSADTTARTWTIPANSSVAFPIGTRVTFINQNAAGAITIAITTDVMRLAGAGTTGSRTLAANGIATAIKLTATEWIISGTGLT
jgi:hypothetical protein